MKKVLYVLMALTMTTLLFAGCSGEPQETTSQAPASESAEPAAEASEAPVAEEVEVAEISADDLTLGFCFVDLETPFWVAGYTAITTTLRDKGVEVIEYNASEDPIKQQQMCKDALAEGIDGMIIIPQDGDVAVAIAADYNDAGVPLGVFNRPPSDDNTKAIVAVADNEAISQKAMEAMAEEAKKVFESTGKKVLPLCMVGDLGDPNAVYRQKGFDTVVAANPNVFEEAIYVNTNWDAKVALDNLTSAIKANPNVGLIFCGSDFLYPQIQQVLEANDMWHKIGEEGHVILGAVDGDSTAGRLMDEGYVDATAVQDLYFEVELILNGMVEAINAGEKAPMNWMDDPGFALTQSNMSEKRMDMWGNKVRQANGEIE
jgi:inositol transport system substrate-binding protein